MFSIFTEIDNKNGISKNGIKPWNYPEINLFISKLFKNNVIIMGRKTWDILPVRPIPDSLNIVISQSCNLKESEYADVILES
jgi:dihydrofolate reductase